jgi:hypothetical protein
VRRVHSLSDAAISDAAITAANAIKL